MAASPSEQIICRHLRKMANQNPGVTFVVLRASNGEVAIVPEDMTEYTSSGEQTVKSQCRDIVNYVMSVVIQRYPSKSSEELMRARSVLATSIVVQHRDGKTIYSLNVPELRMQLERVSK